jgi:chromosome segregation ATPase
MQIDTRPEAMLRRENHDLRQQLREAENANAALRAEITALRRQLAKYETESTIEEELMRTPKMRIEEHFSDSEEDGPDTSSHSPNVRVHFSSTPSPAPSPLPLSHSSTLSSCRERQGEGEKSRQLADMNRSSSKKVIISTPAPTQTRTNTATAGRRSTASSRKAQNAGRKIHKIPHPSRPSPLAK